MQEKKIETIKRVYFIGIGGIGMSALARYFHSKGIAVSGYDKTETALTKALVNEGIPVHYEDNPERAPRDADWIVFTPAIPADHQELNNYKTGGYPVMKRSEVLQKITESSFNICVAGTHGKTTTTTMIAHLLRDSGYGCNAFLGGISANYDTNFWSSEKDVCVIEADEYDRSFLKLSPDIAVVTAIDPDHLDIYGSAEQVRQAFADFAQRLKRGGLLIRKLGIGRELKAERMWQYSLQNDSANIYAANIKIQDGGYVFDVVLPAQLIEGLQLNMGGMHNIENMVAAIAVAGSLNIDPEKIRTAVASFKGVKRRFEYIIKEKNLVFIDDYAHHPEELKALINSVKTLFPQKKCTLIFQPHLYSRTKDFAQDFAAVLSTVNRTVLLPVYPAREQPIPGVESNTIAELMEGADPVLMTKEALLKWVEDDFSKNREQEFGEVIITAGAGDIDKMVAPVKDRLLNRK
ncbi:UDP-N-acetylmuramate--L-alanine ligase [Niabella drilacis]|uniref:UDP-N-acetylmuramate--L-alanine ligase n=1 Tax=Niabella drilacis (strain DSM 25811 / CCM 8410 / CCUG 62505 / LMG 26954 / E90) TaxID=1285928 RepID=A0A1G6T352_NIADE|nr:UDP-N-acetylmuramate--L-alanine ligase [Niabella drilacis]SDD22795.1 UDP-N-acetylmuramate--L-alanine ligase [Niabella drilacis]